jgi:hypothetical protein
MPAPFDYTIQQPDANSYFDAVRRGRADQQAVVQDQRNNALAKYLPQALQGDEGARQQAIASGSPDQMIQMKQLFTSMDAPKLQAVKEFRTKSAAGAVWAKTPQQWDVVQSTLQAEAQAQGLPFKPVPFEQKDAMAAMGQTVDQLIDQTWKEKGYNLQRDQFGESRRHNIATEQAMRERADKAAATSGAANQDYVSSVANYDAPLPSPRSPDFAAVISAAKKLNPDFNVAEYKLRADAKGAFRKGPDARSVQYISTALDHLDTLKLTAEALGSTDVTVINRARNAWYNQFGSELPTNLSAAKQIVGNEVIKGIVGGQNALADREEAQKIFAEANSPEQIIGGIKTVKHLLAGQLRGFERRYKASTKANDFNEFISEDARNLLREGAAAARPSIVGPKGERLVLSEDGTRWIPAPR